ncbi:MAG TPA: hypothetical protein VEN47_07085, partial [Myxococcota bacterium]|nr:hypothetical protein [Myxococcota bacterium]
EQHALASFGRPGVLLEPPALSGRAAAAERLRSAALAAALVAVAAVGALAALAFASPLAGALACVPPASAALALLGLLGGLRIALDSCSAALPPLVAALSALPALQYLARVRELSGAGAELGVAVSIALRDAGRPIVEGAVASATSLALLAACAPHLRAWSALACIGYAVGAASALGLLPVWVRALQPGFARSPEIGSAGETLSSVRRANRERDGDAGHR